jgi:hypothetical protein
MARNDPGKSGDFRVSNPDIRRRVLALAGAAIETSLFINITPHAPTR